MKETKKSLSSGHGFTLIEVLVVLIIMAIVATMVSVSIIGADRTVRLRNLAEEISLMIPLAEQQAILQPTQIGIVFADHHYKFYRYVSDDNDPSQGDWKLIKDDRVFVTKNYSNDITVKIQVPQNVQNVIDQSDIYIRPQLMMFSSGDILPFTMTLAIKNNAPLYKITGEANGTVTLERLGPKPAATKLPAKVSAKKQGAAHDQP